MLQQVLERQNEVLCVLTQKIVTTQKCVISEHVQIEDKCGGMMGIQTKTVQVRTGRAEARAGATVASLVLAVDLGQGPRWVVLHS